MRSACTASAESSGRCSPACWSARKSAASTARLVTQLWGVGTTLIYGFVMSMIILKVIDLTIGLRVTPDEEREGLDISQHGESIE